MTNFVFIYLIKQDISRNIERISVSVDFQSRFPDSEKKTGKISQLITQRIELVLQEVVGQQLLLKRTLGNDLDALRAHPGLGNGRGVEDLVVINLGLIFESLEVIENTVAQKIVHRFRNKRVGQISGAHSREHATKRPCVVRRHRPDVSVEPVSPVVRRFEAVNLEKLVQQRKQDGVIVRQHKQVDGHQIGAGFQVAEGVDGRYGVRAHWLRTSVNIDLPTNFRLLASEEVLCERRRLELVLVEREVVDDHRFEICAAELHVRVRGTLRQRRRVDIGPEGFGQRPETDGEAFLSGPGHEDESSAVVPSGVWRRQDRIGSVRPWRVRPASSVQLFVEVQALDAEHVIVLQLVERDRVGSGERNDVLVGSIFAVANRCRVRPDFLEVDDDAGLKFLDQTVDALMKNPLRRDCVWPPSSYLKKIVFIIAARNIF